MIALIGKPTVGKSTIVRTGMNNLTPIKNIGVDHNIIKGKVFIIMIIKY